MLDFLKGKSTEPDKKDTEQELNGTTLFRLIRQELDRQMNEKKNREEEEKNERAQYEALQAEHVKLLG